MPPAVYIKPEVIDEPMEDAADLALSDEAVKPEGSVDIQAQPPWNGPAPPQQACESQFQLTMPANPFPSRQATPPQSVNCSACPTDTTSGYYNPGVMTCCDETSEEKRHKLQDYNMHLMLLEQQNKKRLATARQEQDAMAIPRKQEDKSPSPSVKEEQEAPKALSSSRVQTPQRATQTFHMVDVVAEEQCKERLQKARREQDAMLIPPVQHAQTPQMAKQDLCIQAAESFLAEQQNKERPQDATRDLMPSPPVQHAKASTQNNQGHALQDHQMQLMLLEQQNKKRIMMQRQEQIEQGRSSVMLFPKGEVQSSKLPKEDFDMPEEGSVMLFPKTIPKEEAQASKPTQEDYEEQLRLLEQQNKKRLMMEQLRLLEQHNKKRLMMVRLEQDAVSASLKQNDNTPKQAEPDYQTQLRLLEQANKKRLMMARQEQDAFKEQREAGDDAASPSGREPQTLMQWEGAALKRDQQNNVFARPKQPGIISKMEGQVTALERYTKKRLALARMDHSGSPLSVEQRAKLLAKWEADYKEQVLDAAKPAEQGGQQGKPLADWENEYFLELYEATRPPQTISPPQPQFVDWEAQARAHIGVGAKDTLSPENRKKVDDIIKRKYQQVWGLSDKEDNGQKTSDPPVIQTYQEQLRAQKMTQIPAMTPQQRQLLQQQTQQFLQRGPPAWLKSSIASASQTSPPTADQAIKEQAAARFPNNTAAREDYETQMKMLKQQNALRQQRMASAIAHQQDIMKQQHDSVKQYHHYAQVAQAHRAASEKGSAFQDYETQMKLLEQQNKKRLLMADQETQCKKRMMTAKDSEQLAVVKPENTSNNAAPSTSSASGNCCWCGVKMARSSCCATNNRQNAVKRVSDYPEASRGHSLQDYQTQLMHLEQNRLRAGLPSAATPTQETLELQKALTTEEKAQLAAMAQQPNNAQVQQQRKQIEMKALQRQAQAETMQNHFSVVSDYPIANQETPTMTKEELDRAAELTPGQGQMLRAYHQEEQIKAMQRIQQRQQQLREAAQRYHPAAYDTPAPQQDSRLPSPWRTQPMARPASSYSPVYYSVNSEAPARAPMCGMRDANCVDTREQYSQPLPASPFTVVPIPEADRPQVDESSTAAAATAPVKAEDKQEEDIYSVPRERSEDSDWSRLSTPVEEDDFVVVEHGALPIRTALPDEQC